MKTLFTLVLLLFVHSFAFAQTDTCECKKDLDFLVKKMKKTPGYKHQIKKKKKTEFDALYEELATQMTSEISVEECFRLLSKQMNIVKDYHSGVTLHTMYFSKDNLESAEKITEFKNSDFYKSFPKIDTDITALRNRLQAMPDDAFEGVYYMKGALVIGITKTETDNEYIGVVLESELPTWEAGQIHFYATKNEYGKYDIYNYHVDTFNLRLVKNLTFENGRIWSYKKAFNDYNHELYAGEEGNWIFQELNDSVHYIRISHFSGSRSNRKAQKQFYSELEDKNPTQNLILDLRSNGGGSFEVSDPFLSLFKEMYGTIYIITNGYTASNAEQFTVKLIAQGNTIHVGQTTFGIIAYGSDKEWPTSPSGKFTFKVMDMDFHNEYFKYEGKGIEPAIKLDFSSDWVEQTVQRIVANQAN